MRAEGERFMPALPPSRRIRVSGMIDSRCPGAAGFPGERSLSSANDAVRRQVGAMVSSRLVTLQHNSSLCSSQFNVQSHLLSHPHKVHPMQVHQKQVNDPTNQEPSNRLRQEPEHTETVTYIRLRCTDQRLGVQVCNNGDRRLDQAAGQILQVRCAAAIELVAFALFGTVCLMQAVAVESQEAGGIPDGMV